MSDAELKRLGLYLQQFEIVLFFTKFKIEESASSCNSILILRWIVYLGFW
jgi:hypothetical protein